MHISDVKAVGKIRLLFFMPPLLLLVELLVLSWYFVVKYMIVNRLSSSALYDSQGMQCTRCHSEERSDEESWEYKK